MGFEAGVGSLSNILKVEQRRASAMRSQVVLRCGGECMDTHECGFPSRRTQLGTSTLFYLWIVTSILASILVPHLRCSL